MTELSLHVLNSAVKRSPASRLAIFRKIIDWECTEGVGQGGPLGSGGPLGFHHGAVQPPLPLVKTVLAFILMGSSNRMDPNHPPTDHRRQDSKRIPSASKVDRSQTPQCFAATLKVMGDEQVRDGGSTEGSQVRRSQHCECPSQPARSNVAVVGRRQHH